MLDIFGDFITILLTFWCPFYRPKQCGGAPKLTNIWNLKLKRITLQSKNKGQKHFPGVLCLRQSNTAIKIKHSGISNFYNHMRIHLYFLVVFVQLLTSWPQFQSGSQRKKRPLQPFLVKTVGDVKVNSNGISSISSSKNSFHIEKCEAT